MACPQLTIPTSQAHTNTHTMVYTQSNRAAALWTSACRSSRCTQSVRCAALMTWRWRRPTLPPSSSEQDGCITNLPASFCWPGCWPWEQRFLDSRCPCQSTHTHIYCSTHIHTHNPGTSQSWIPPWTSISLPPRQTHTTHTTHVPPKSRTPGTSQSLTPRWTSIRCRLLRFAAPSATPPAATSTELRSRRQQQSPAAGGSSSNSSRRQHHAAAPRGSSTRQWQRAGAAAAPGVPHHPGSVAATTQAVTATAVACGGAAVTVAYGSGAQRRRCAQTPHLACRRTRVGGNCLQSLPAYIQVAPPLCFM